MRLKHIKLAGFKSFVDPTTVTFPGNRCAVVGPNGCGKSNIIDAVRWVMGESSAKQLRGESITDVIFNGSAARKPTSMASIELVFDNSDGRIGGEYATYNEISIRRQVTRDAQSTYFLNGNKCRRRDILDIFLGTGFGPRSYSIIEQGMISQLVEAKPEDLRVYLEEAAGISKYKERRRETENRIRHTQENLDRLNDIREELGRQLQHLDRQAKAAEKYKTLKAEQQQLTAELYSLRLINLETDLQSQEAGIRDLEVALEKARAEQRALDADIERSRDEHSQRSEAFNQVQGRYYQVGTEIARIEEALQYGQQRVKQLELDLGTVAQRREEIQRQLTMDETQIAELEAALAERRPELEQVRTVEAVAAEALQAVEAGNHAWQQRWDAFNDRAGGNQRELDVQASRIEHIEQLLERLQARQQQLGDEYQGALDVQVDGEMDELAGSIRGAEQRLRDTEQALEVCLEALSATREAQIDHERQLDEARARFQSLRHDLASLEALQQAALGRSNGGDAGSWIEAHGLHDNSRLGEDLSVEAGWEHAVEVVLGDRLQAIEVDALSDFGSALEQLQDGAVTLFEGRAELPQPAAMAGLTSLLSRVRSGRALGSLLGAVLTADSLDQALALRSALAPHQSIITRAGVWVGPDWIRHDRGESADSGILERGQELEKLRTQVDASEEMLAASQEAVAAGRERLDALNHQRGELQAEINRLSQMLGELRREHGVHQVRQEEADARRERLQKERGELEQQIEHEQARLAEARERLTEARVLQETLREEREVLAAEREQNLAALEGARDRARTERDRFHALNTEVQGLESKLNATRTAWQRLQEQRKELDQRDDELKAGIDESRTPLPELRRNLEVMLEERHGIEQQMNESRAALESIEARVRELEAQRSDRESVVNDVRGQLESARVERQGLAVNRANLLEQIRETGLTFEQVRAGLPEDATEPAWAEQLDKLLARIQRLGAINLAAIDEYQSAAERKQYLDEQHDDLNEALETLQNAIKRIDRDTRQRFKETFDQVNARLKELFPRVFGGGHAYMELTGDDLLDTGVSLMARPPGKRNASVHMLSGGEKAMTAVALIFSIFHLNPSPVCLLDEVDAPLDDSNVIRFADLIRSMSEEVQFIFITHNKLTMEMADQLMGVTMNEPGVSRMVTVDVEEAAAMAEL
jgi:chromosome segregation protein